MRSERLTRKTRFRKLRDFEPAAMVMDCTVDPAGYDDLREHYMLSELLSDAVALDADAIETAFDDEYDALLWCTQVINHSPTALSLMREAEMDGWSVTLDDLKNEGFYIDTESRIITLDHFGLQPSALGRSGYFCNILLTTLVRALRDVWHYNHIGDVELHYAVEDVLMMERVRAADGDSVTILCGWELRAAGFTDVWRHILGSEEGDMAIVFTRYLERDPGSLFTGAAIAYALRQWYADASRVDGVDHETLEYLDTLIQEDGFILGQNRIDALMIEAISQLPSGIVYLSGLGQGILKDPFFAGLNDTINQTHLFHMIYDSEVVMVNNVPFRDGKLARLIFPDADRVVTAR